MGRTREREGRTVRREQCLREQCLQVVIEGRRQFNPSWPRRAAATTLSSDDQQRWLSVKFFKMGDFDFEEWRENLPPEVDAMLVV